jgi:hypothetical protein
MAMSTLSQKERQKKQKQIIETIKKPCCCRQMGPNRIEWHKNSPWRRGLDSNSTGPDADDFGFATLAELGRDPAIGFASLRADGGEVVGALGDVGGVGEVAGAGDGACEGRWDGRGQEGGHEGGVREIHLEDWF